MDLNYLFSRHQTSLMRADRAVCPASRAAHLGLAAGYAARIDAQQARSGASHRRDVHPARQVPA